MGIKEISMGRMDIFKVDPKVLQEEEGFNLREEGPELDQYIADLAAYIKNNGIPGVLTIHMKGDQAYVIDGHCRRRAALMAIEQGSELKSVPCRMVDRHDSEVDKIAYLITTNSGRPLSTMEKASVVKRLHVLTVDNKTIAGKLGMSVAYVGQLLELAAAPVEIANSVKAGEVSATLAIEEMKKDPVEAPNKIKKAVEKAKAEGKKKATKQHIEKPEKSKVEKPVDVDVNAIIEKAFEAANVRDFESFQAGWNAGLRYQKKNKVTSKSEKVEPETPKIEVTHDMLVEAADDLQAVLDLSPPIDINRPDDILMSDIKKASGELYYTDIVDVGQLDAAGEKPQLLLPETITTLLALGIELPKPEPPVKEKKESKKKRR